ncbi:CLUMA_CG013078, isoform A [Clunio marinus]|uniref:CLUMA_CG013078, isoform A n=1 Tax=Clunio marinus TaxID=568069 RepID=A0A1J1IJF9_9DIPT|nr:CLUMA_CG013078, isoform A [Clunio marinus]
MACFNFTHFIINQLNLHNNKDFKINSNFIDSIEQIYSKASQHYNPFVTSSYKPQVYQLPLPGLFVQPNSYVNGANIFTSHPVTYGGQFHTQQVPFHQFTYNPIQPINPVIHTAPIASFSNSYQAPANSFYPGQQLHKFPIYHQQPQFYHVQTSFQPQNYNNQLKQFPISSSTSHRIVASKPLAFQSIIPPTQPSSTSQIEHDNHGSVSFTQISHLNEGKPSASPLIAATHPPQQVYYHQQPTPVYNGDYNKQFQYAAVPLRIAPNFYSSQGSNIPYANINRIQFSTPTAVSALIPSITTIPHKVSFP